MSSTPLPVYSGSEPPAAVLDEPFFRERIAQIESHLRTVLELPALESFVETRRLPRAFLDHLNAALAIYDQLIDFVLAYDQTDKQIRCTKGCSNCCIDLVRGVTTPEIINIYNYVRSWPDAKQIFEYHRESASLFMDMLQSLLVPGESSFGGRDPRIVKAHVMYNSQKRPCGFLDQQSGCCRIYPVRPLACRYFFSMDPPEMCTPSHESYLKRRTRTIHLPESVHALLLEIGRRLRFRPLNYLSGAFCGFAAEVMHAKPVEIIDEPAT